MHKLFSAVFAALVLFTLALPAEAAKRVALVIGNGAYTATTRLENPPNDAADMAAILRRIGFEVVEVADGDWRGMMAAIREFGERSAGAEAALFYYAGHGLQVGDTNYMLPVSAEVVKEQDLEFEAVEVDLPLRLMDRSGARVKLVILDACRNNPLAQTLASSMAASGRGASVGRGLARIVGAEGTMMAFATAPGAIAEDGTTRNSPFTRALLANIETPGLEVSLLFRRVRAEVMAATGDQQVPWVNEALLGEFYFVPAAAAAVLATPAPTAAQNAEIVFWNTIQNSADAADFEAYLTRFPDGVFAGLAQIRLESILSAGREVASLPPATETPGFEIEEMEAPYRVVTRANLRAGPSTDFERVGQLDVGSEITVTGKVRGQDWFRVASTDGLVGFIFGRLIQEAGTYQEAVAPLPEPAVPTVPWPTDVQYEPSARLILETHPGFQGAPPLRLRSARTVTRYPDGTSINRRQLSFAEIRPGVLREINVSDYLSNWMDDPGAYQADTVYTTISILGGLLDFALDGKGRVRYPGTDEHSDTGQRITVIENIKGQLFPLAIGNRMSFTYRTVYEDRNKGTRDETLHEREFEVVSRELASTRDSRIPGHYFMILERTRWWMGDLSGGCTYENTYFEALGAALDVGASTNRCDGGNPRTQYHDLEEIDFLRGSERS